MRRTSWCTWVWLITGILWVKAFIVAALRLEGSPVPWELELLREPVTVAVLAAGTVTMVVWHLVAPMGVVWKLAYRAGRRDAKAAAEYLAEPGSNVVPMQRTRSQTTGK